MGFTEDVLRLFTDYKTDVSFLQVELAEMTNRGLTQLSDQL